MQRLCATVLVMEAIVIGLAIPVAVQLEHASTAAAVAGGVLAFCAVLLAALARWRIRWTIIGGSVLQVLAIASGAVVLAMYVLGTIFAALWIIAIMLGRWAERQTPAS